MVLLHLMNEAARCYDWKLTLAHLNHQLRGKSSEADAHLVKRTAKQLGWPVVVDATNVRELARREKLSMEMAARKARHEFLARTAARLRIHTIALAHHADDQLELFFLRLFRGSGSQGLVGMKWRNASPVDKRIELVRPLLDQSRAALAKYAEANRVSFREDRSNASLDFQRNRIRHELLPLIRKRYQPALETVISRVLEITHAEADFVTQAALAPNLKGGAVPSTNRFEKLPKALQRRSLQLQLLDLGIAPDFDLVEQLRLKPGQAICVSSDKVGNGVRRVSRYSTGLVRVEKAETPIFQRDSAVVKLGKGSGEVNFNGIRVRWASKLSKTAKLPPRVANCEWFDADQIGSKVLLRHWRPGDRFHPIGMPCALKLQDFFTAQKVPRQRRHQLLLAVSAGGDVFWVEGMRIAERFKLAKTTIRRLQWRWQRL